MPKKFTPKVITANALLEGDVVYLASDGSWTRWHENARFFEDETEVNEAMKSAARQADLVVGVYLADAQTDKAGVPRPVHFREAFRTRGPSNYPEHGKQAEVKSDVSIQSV